MLRGSHQRPQLANVGAEWSFLVFFSWTAPAPTSIVRLTFPEDHPAPDTPLDVLFKGRSKTGKPDRATTAERLGARQVDGTFGKEQIVLAGGDTLPTLVDIVHRYFLCLPETSGGSEGR